MDVDLLGLKLAGARTVVTIRVSAATLAAEIDWAQVTPEDDELNVGPGHSQLVAVREMLPAAFAVTPP